MLCFLCGKKIGIGRRLVDQQYCCAAHRKEAKLASAQAYREEDELEHWSVMRSKDKKKGSNRPAPTAGQTASVFAFLTVGGLLVAALLLPGPGPGASFPQVSLDPSVKRSLPTRAWDAVGQVVRTQSPVTLHHEFGSGFGDWLTVSSRPLTVSGDREWSSGSRAALSHPVSLRLWGRSAALQNYQMEFQGQMEGRSLSWAFRAANGNNYYATKLVIAKPGSEHNAGLVRYAVIDGRASSAVRLPLPLSLQRGVDYRVRMTVEGDHFVTYLNGQVISSWTDNVLKRGGVGFFEDKSDPQKVAWISLSERDSFMGRMLAYFSLFVVPGPPLEGF
jgi:hypothetical protein